MSNASLYRAVCRGTLLALAALVPPALWAQRAPVHDGRQASSRPAPDWAVVDTAMGRPAVVQPGEVHRFNFPRTDLRVTVRGKDGDIALRPAFALGGWIAMHAADGNTGAVMAMGDLVVTEDELPRVMSRLQEGGVEQSAVHHHVMRESPRVLYMHVSAHGNAVAIAQTIRAAVALTGAPPAPVSPAPTAVAAIPSPLALDTTGIAAALKVAGRNNGGVFQLSIPRPETIREGGMPIPPAMGLGTAINFQPTTSGRAVITGDFVLRAAEVNPVIRALRRNGIEVTSLHNHMLDDEPRLFFMHFWAHDDAVKLARGLRMALDSTAMITR